MGEKYGRAGQAANDNMAHVRLCLIPKATDIYTEYVILIAFFAVTEVA